MGPRAGDHGDKDQKPGPGNYNLNNAVVGPQYGFGSGSRTDAKKDNTPGPGHYKIPVKVADTERFAVPNQGEEFRFV